MDPVSSRRLITVPYLRYLLLGIFLFGGAVGCASIDPEQAIANLQNSVAEETAGATVASVTESSGAESSGAGANGVEAVGSEGAVRELSFAMTDGTVIAATLLLPPDYRVGEPYPTLLALPPGSQTANMVSSGLNSYWRDGALANGWVVISPVAPNGQLFFQGSEQYIPELLDQFAAQYPPEGGKFHLSGVSNGGISAFRIVGTEPERFHSLIALPGYPSTAEDKTQLNALTAIPIALFVGENDSGWIAPMREITAQINNSGGSATLTIVPGEGHFIRSLIGGEELFRLLESYR